MADFSLMGNADENEKQLNSHANCGFISQNVYLYCTSAGLSTVVRGSIDKEEIRKVFKLKDQQHVILTQTVGYPEE